jgi:hypothetical protein
MVFDIAEQHTASIFKVQMMGMYNRRATQDRAGTGFVIWSKFMQVDSPPWT